MIGQALASQNWLAGDISFNIENLREGFWQLTVDGLAWGRSTRSSPSATPWFSGCCG